MAARRTGDARGMALGPPLAVRGRALAAGAQEEETGRRHGFARATFSRSCA